MERSAALAGLQPNYLLCPSRRNFPPSLPSLPFADRPLSSPFSLKVTSISFLLSFSQLIPGYWPGSSLPKTLFCVFTFDLTFSSLWKWLCAQLQKQFPHASLSGHHAGSPFRRDAVLSETYRFAYEYHSYCHYVKWRTLKCSALQLFPLFLACLVIYVKTRMRGGLLKFVKFGHYFLKCRFTFCFLVFSSYII